MKLIYKKLGQFIEEVSIKNHDGDITDLQGVGIEKEFIKSKSNIIGSDMTKYKVVSNSQFVYVPVTSRNSDKISIAIFEGEKCIVSTSYIVFKIINHEELLPDYLMMWFRRSEFDRYARYYSHGSAREVFTWDEMCNVKVPILPIERQREIVYWYKFISDRIQLNQNKIIKLERFAKAIYKSWFVEFEPVKEKISKVSNKHHKYIDQLVPDELMNSAIGPIPKAWEVKPFDQLATFSSGKRQSFISEVKTPYAKYPLYGGNGIIGFTNQPLLNDPKVITTGRVGTIGKFHRVNQSSWMSDNALIIDPLKNYYYCYFSLLNLNFDSITRGSSNPLITQGDLKKILILNAPQCIHDIFEEICIKIFNQIDLKISESENLTIIRQNLLAIFK